MFRLATGWLDSVVGQGGRKGWLDRGRKGKTKRNWKGLNTFCHKSAEATPAMGDPMIVATPWNRIDSPKELANLETPRNSTKTRVLRDMKTAVLIFNVLVMQ